VNLYEDTNPQDRRGRFGGVGYLKNLREMRRNQTRFGVLPPPPNERWTEVVLQDLRGGVLATLLSQTPQDEGPLCQAPADASQGDPRTPRASGVAAVVRGVRRQMPLMWGFRSTPYRGPRDPAIARQLRLHSQLAAIMRYLQQLDRRHDCQLPRRLSGGG
jgi:hypothetical protein